MGSNERIVWHFTSTFGSSRIANSAYQSWPTNDCIFFFFFSFMVYLNNLIWISHPFKVWELVESIALPNPLIIRFTWCNYLDFNRSYPEGNFGRNQLLADSFSLSPLYPNLTMDLHVTNATVLHQTFVWLQPIQA